MEFGLGFWVLFFVIFFGCGRMCGWGRRRHRRRDRSEDIERGVSDDPLQRLESRVADRKARRERLMAGRRHEAASRGREPHPVSTRSRRETPLQELQKKFVEGRLTLSEYERELDLLERID